MSNLIVRSAACLSVAFLLVGSLNSFALSLTNNSARAINGQSVNLKPLQEWWREAEQIVATNRLVPEAERKVVPNRVLSGWIRITTAEATNTPYGAIAAAQLQYSPEQPATNGLIVLRYGPMNEKQRVDGAAQSYQAAAQRQERFTNAAAASADRSAALAARANQYGEIVNSGGGYAFRNLEYDYRVAANQARAAAHRAHRRAQQAEAEMEDWSKITQGRTVYVVDDFALATGEVYKGLPVYHMGFYAR